MNAVVLGIPGTSYAIAGLLIQLQIIKEWSYTVQLLPSASVSIYLSFIIFSLFYSIPAISIYLSLSTTISDTRAVAV